MHQQHSLDLGRSMTDSVGHEAHGSQTEYLLSFINRGTLVMEHKGRLELEAGMFTLIPAGMDHGLIAGEELDVWWLSFCPSCLGLDESKEIMRPYRQVRLGGLPAMKLADSRLDFVNMLFKELLRLKEAAEPIELEITRSLLVLLLAEISRCTAIASPGTANSPKVLAALDYIQQHFLQPISLKQVAQAVHTSPSYLATLVKTETGYSVGQWLIRNRLTHACSRLLHTSEPVAQLAEQSGWKDTTHFIRQFKRAFGQTPAAWRKQQRSHRNL